MKQQSLEKALEDMMWAVQEAKNSLHLVGQYNDTESIVRNAISKLDRALEYYDTAKKIPKNTISIEPIQKG